MPRLGLIGGLTGSAVSNAIHNALKKRPSSSSGSSRRPSSGGSSISFNPNMDYQAAINDAVSRGDYQSAAIYEQQRNDKINAGYGGGYGTTNNWSQYLPSSGTSSGSSGGSSGSSSGGSFGSTTTTTPTNTTPDWLQQAQANSVAWHATTDQAERDRLHAENQKLYSSHGYTYDNNTGRWSAPSSSSGSSSMPGGILGNIAGGIMGSAAGAIGNALGNLNSGNSSSGIPNADYSNVDLGNTFWQSALQGGANIDYLQSIADARLEKAQNNSELGQFYNDQNQLAMQAYINQLRQQQEYADAYNQYYEDALAQQQEAWNEAAEQAAMQYQQMIPTINQSYDQSARQAYINNRLAQRDLPEQLAAAGIAGQGAAESSIVAQNNAYTAALMQNELARQNALDTVNNNIANAYANASAQGAQSAADIMLQQANAQQNILAMQEQMRQNALQGLYNYAGLTGNIGGMPTLSAQELANNTAYNNALLQMNQQGQQFDQQEAEWNRWFNLFQAAGRVTNQAMADALGLPIGTTTAQYQSMYL